ncbi:MAG: amidohydrolase family protein [Acidobacteriaceae bacterium]
MALGTSSSLHRRTPRIDAHHHLWRYTPEEFGWIDESMAPLRRDFSIADLQSAMHTASIDGAIAVQARQSLAETHSLLDLAETSSAICGVVGWAPLLAPGLASALDQLSGRARLVGLREIVQAEPEGFLDQPAFDRGIAELTRRDLAYDLLLRHGQLEEATRFVDRHPHQRFVLDHAAKPPIAAARLEPWRTHIRSLAQRQNVFCKLSGLATEAIWSLWTLDHLRPYLDVCVDAFGPSRLMAGSDWPVSLLASSYSNWWSTLAAYLAPFTASEQERIMGGTAIAFYRIALEIPPTTEASS